MASFGKLVRRQLAKPQKLEKNMKKVLLVVCSLLLVLGLSACGGSSGNGNSFLRVVHGSPDAPNVDVIVDGQVVLSNVPYNTVSAYLLLEPATIKVQVNAAGTDTTVIDADLTLNGGDSLTVIASNLVASISPLVLVDDRSRPQLGNAKVRAVHNAVSAPNVDIYVTEPGADITALEPTLSDIPYTAASDYLQVPAGAYQVQITPTGDKTVVIDSGEISLADGDIFTLIAQDAAGGGAPFGLLIAQDN